jgi:precorrin isomerase
MANQTPYDASSDRVGVTTHISATSVNENPFLTASEKAIIDRAASSSGDPDAMKQLNFSDAISSFINKSRRLTYKISP